MVYLGLDISYEIDASSRKSNDAFIFNSEIHFVPFGKVDQD